MVCKTALGTWQIREFYGGDGNFEKSEEKNMNRLQKNTRKYHHQCPAKSSCDNFKFSTCVGCNANDDGYKWRREDLRRFKDE